MEIKHKLETQDEAVQRHLAAQNDVIHKLTGNVDILAKEIKQITAEMKLIKGKNKEQENIFRTVGCK